MEDSIIRELREEIVNALENYEGEPKVLDLPMCLLKQILFDDFYGSKNGAFQFVNKNSKFFQIYKKIDFSNVNFDNVYVAGQDLGQFKGININPQTIESKSLTGTKLNGVTITGPFDDVDVRGANFTGAKGSLEINPQEVYDKSLEGTILNGVTITGSFIDVHISGVNFEGAKGELCIDPSFVRYKTIANTKLSGVSFVGNFDNCSISSADFTGSTGAKIDPQRIASLTCAKLSGVEIIGPFNSCFIQGVDFTGSTGAKINPQTILYKDLSKTKLSGVEFIGPFDGCYFKDADFTGSIEAKISLNKVQNSGCVEGVKFADVRFIDTIDRVGLQRCDFTGSKGACIVIDGEYLSLDDLKSINFKDAYVYVIMTDEIKESLVNIEGATIVELPSESEKQEKIKQYCLTKIKKLGEK